MLQYSPYSLNASDEYEVKNFTQRMRFEKLSSGNLWRFYRQLDCSVYSVDRNVQCKHPRIQPSDDRQL